MVRDRDETETFGNYVSRPSRDRDVETETTSLVYCISFQELGLVAMRKSYKGRVLVVNGESETCAFSASL